MPTEPPQQAWDHSFRNAAGKVRDATADAEDEVRRFVAYINDNIVPDVRRNGSAALRTAAAKLERLARRMDDAERPSAPGPTQKP